MSQSWRARLRVITGDITHLNVDAIVNAANRSLMGGGGVDGAIHRAAGPELLDACRNLRRQDWPDGLPDGDVALTDGFKLPARYVIHTVGPVYARTKDKSHLLANCYRNSLALAAEHGCTSIAFPAISTGVYGYPFDDAARVVCGLMAEVLPNYSELHVTLCFFSDQDARAFQTVYEQVLAAD
ncbi:O-acetyl-ADP-ribose deacetylase [Larsenimonas rhizosphaerae]|uniref:O-acetyl-ADP-ribose deacetylase n=1 Tax=Larsenimonas rhizosphaerae TaxID=2944682 RepID=UPI00203454EB|nr:O-acetyl-ADP-ribose deacetylase [Larsenimonas rhizosphaerae]MCM2129473.1 O-acetyl-ADP-ribose deacetylase [Larsenimonas rhizosphaerae]